MNPQQPVQSGSLISNNITSSNAAFQNTHQTHPRPEASPLRGMEPIKRRYSITTMLTLTSLLVLLLLISMAAMMQSRLLSFQTNIGDIANNAIPSVVHSSKVYSQINELLYLSEALGQAPSQAVRHNLYLEIQQNLQGLEALSEDRQSVLYQEAQLVALTEELSSLNELISERLDLQQQVQARLAQVYQLYEQLQGVASSETTVNRQQSTGLLDVAEVVAQSGKAITINRLLVLRQLQQKVSEQLQQVSLGTKQTLPHKATLLQQQLQQLLLADDGVFPLRIQQLVITGRANGRSNFVRNLVLDYARLAENSAYDVSVTVLADAELSNAQIRQYSQQILLVSALAILFLAAGIYLVHLRVVRRLEQLNTNVLKQMQGKAAAHQISGHDEISMIARSFQYFSATVKQQQLELELLSYTDSLTGLANRRALELRLAEQLSQAQRQQWPLSLLMIDVDCFKAFNDHYGHQAGDLTLQQIAVLMQQGFNRATDIVARYGGEEFLVILPNTNKAGALVLAQQLQQLVEKSAIPHAHNLAAPYVTVSIGVASLERAGPADYDLILRQADNSLYQAKEAGRNQVV
jgi:diguanylate cyclase (GGDEF)-like protein